MKTELKTGAVILLLLLVMVPEGCVSFGMFTGHRNGKRTLQKVLISIPCTRAHKSNLNQNNLLNRMFKKHFFSFFYRKVQKKNVQLPDSWDAVCLIAVNLETKILKNQQKRKQRQNMSRVSVMLNLSLFTRSSQDIIINTQS